MPPLRTLRDGLGDEQLRIAILVGLATVPITVALSWESLTDAADGTVSGEALLLAGVFVGYYYNEQPTAARRAGIWAGLAGSLGALLVSGANSVSTMSSAVGSAYWPWATVVLLPISVAFTVGFSVLVTALTAMGTDWVLTRLDRDRRVAEPESRDDAIRTGRSKWRTAIAAYAGLAPVALSYALWLGPDSDAGIVISVLLLFVLVPLSLVALVGLVADATEPRAAGWLPSVWLYVGGPIGAGVLVYLVAAARGVGYPPGYGQYAFLGALWLAATAYLVNGYRYRRRGRRGVGAV